MRNNFVSAILCWTFCSAMLLSCGQQDEASDYPNLPGNISDLPETIRIKAVGGGETYAVKDESLTYPYTWTHSVTIEAIDEEIQILEFGVFVFIDGEWIDATEDQEPYSKELFAEWFACPDAKLIPGNLYTSDNFANASSMLPKQNRVSRWYFIGELSQGRCRGEVTLIDLNSVE